MNGSLRNLTLGLACCLLALGFVKSGDLRAESPAFAGNESVVSSPGDDYCAHRGPGNTIDVCDQAGNLLLILPHRSDAELRPEMFSPRGDALVALDIDAGTSLYELPSGRCRFRPTSEKTEAAMFLPKRDVIVVAKPRVIYDKNAADNSLVYGRILARRGEFLRAIFVSNPYGTQRFPDDVRQAR